MNLDDIERSTAFQFKNIPICWVVSHGNGGQQGTRLVFDLKKLCHELDFDYKNVLAHIEYDTYNPYQNEWRFNKIDNPFYIKTQNQILDVPKRHTIDFSVRMAMKEHFQHIN